MEYVISIIVSVVAAVLGANLKTVINENRELRRSNDEKEAKWTEAVGEGVRQLLSVKLEELYNRYSDSETIPRRVYDRWMKMHKAYKGLDGNGTFDHMKEELNEKHIIDG